MIRVGLGQDSHQIKSKVPACRQGRKNKKLKVSRFGGLELKNCQIIADSDGDVLYHALCNALSSALGGDSLGTWADQMCQNGISNSQKYLELIFKKIRQQKFHVNNLSLCVEAQKPRFTPQEIQQIRLNLSRLLEVNPDSVGLTFTSGDQLTPFGQGKAIQVFALASLIKK